MATSAEIRQQLVAALRSDLIGPGRDNKARRHEQLSQPPSVWYTTGFLVPHVFQQEAERQTADQQLQFADLAGEDPSNDAANRLEKKERDEDASDSLDQANTRRTWFPSSLGMSFILERGSSLEATVSWGDYSPPSEGDPQKVWARTPMRVQKTFTIDRPGSSPDIPTGSQSGRSLPALDRQAGTQKTCYPSDQLSVSLFLLNKRDSTSNQVRYRDPHSAFQAELSLHCPQGFPPRRDALLNASNQDNDEALAALQYRRDFCFASGHNVAVIADGVDAGRPDRAFTLTTTWLPTAEVMRVLPEPPTEVANVPMTMEALADLAQSDQIISKLQPMVKAYRHWIARQPAHPIEDPVLNETAKNLCSQAQDCADRIEGPRPRTWCKSLGSSGTRLSGWRCKGWAGP